MALTTSKSVTLTGQSKVTINKEEVIAVVMTCSLQNGTNSSVVTTVVDKVAYDANKSECRADIDEFTGYVREVEDSELE
jgi:hypothetical protein